MDVLGRPTHLAHQAAQEILHAAQRLELARRVADLAGVRYAIAVGIAPEGELGPLRIAGVKLSVVVAVECR